MRRVTAPGLRPVQRSGSDLSLRPRLDPLVQTQSQDPPRWRCHSATPPASTVTATVPCILYSRTASGPLPHRRPSSRNKGQTVLAHSEIQRLRFGAPHRIWLARPCHRGAAPGDGFCPIGSADAELVSALRSSILRTSKRESFPTLESSLQRGWGAAVSHSRIPVAWGPGPLHALASKARRVRSAEEVPGRRNEETKPGTGGS